MSLEDLARETLGASPLGLPSESGRQPTTRLDYISVITRMYDEDGYPVLWIKNQYYSFVRFSATKINNILEIKYFGW